MSEFCKITSSTQGKERFARLCARMGWKHYQGIDVLTLLGEQASDKQLLVIFRQLTEASGESSQAA